MLSAVAIRHVSFEDAGTLSGVLSDRSIRLRYVDAGVDSFVDIDSDVLDLLIVLGGPIGAYDEAEYPFILKELQILERRLERGLPTLGICLGAQMMARALGAEVYAAPTKEIGWTPLALTSQGRRTSIAPLAGNATSMLHWHGDTFELPASATLLASTDACRNQIFSWGSAALAFQCHPEIRAGQIERWLIGHAVELSQAGISASQIRDDTARYASVLESRASECFNDWLGRVGL